MEVARLLCEAVADEVKFYMQLYPLVLLLDRPEYVGAGVRTVGELLRAARDVKACDLQRWLSFQWGPTTVHDPGRAWAFHLSVPLH
jgi:hypothetical protein